MLMAACLLGLSNRVAAGRLQWGPGSRKISDVKLKRRCAALAPHIGPLVDACDGFRREQRTLAAGPKGRCVGPASHIGSLADVWPGSWSTRAECEGFDPAMAGRNSTAATRRRLVSYLLALRRKWRAHSPTAGLAATRLQPEGREGRRKIG